MRHNQNGRRFRGRGNNGGGGGHSHQHQGGGNSGQGRRMNPRVQTFDSNGPEVRIRGTAFQINEKYLALARDATAASDRVLAESYFQHAEHYQRLINEMTEEYNKHQPQHQQQQQMPAGDSADAADAADASDQPVVGMGDLDQGFLIGPRNGGEQPKAALPDGQDAVGLGEQPGAQQHRGNRQYPRQQKETGQG